MCGISNVRKGQMRIWQDTRSENVNKKKSKKILLISPPYLSLRKSLPTPAAHIGLMNLAAFLKAKGYKCKVLIADLFANVQAKNYIFLKPYFENADLYEKYMSGELKSDIWRTIRNITADYEPDIVGITTTSPAAASAIKVAGIVKAIDDDIKVIAGGPHATFCSESLIEHNDIDYVIRGEGEIALGRLIERIELDDTYLNDIPSLTYKGLHGMAHKTENAEQITDLDKLTFPDPSALILPENYRLTDYAIQATRGCVHNCAFCSGKRLWHKFTYRSAKNVCDEIMYIRRKYPEIINFYFTDATLTFNKAFILELCREIIKNNIKASFYGTARFDKVDKEMLALMKYAGFKGLYIGAESGDDHILTRMDKNISTQDIVRKIKLVKNAGIAPLVSILLGVPGDNIESLNKTYAMMKNLGSVYFDVNTYLPLPGTKWYGEMTEDFKEKVNYLKYHTKCFHPFLFDTYAQKDCMRMTRKIVAFADRRMILTALTDKILSFIRNHKKTKALLELLYDDIEKGTSEQRIPNKEYQLK